VWTVVWGKFLKMDNLMRRGYALAGWCCMYRGNGQMVDHLFLHCPKVVGLWNFVFQSYGVVWVLPGQVKDLLFAWQN
jgi:hypothetical protein